MAGKPKSWKKQGKSHHTFKNAAEWARTHAEGRTKIRRNKNGRYDVYVKKDVAQYYG